MIVWVALRRLLALAIRVLLMNRIVTLGILGILVAGLLVAPALGGSTGSLNQPASPNAAPSTASTSTQPQVKEIIPAASAVTPASSVQDYIKGMTTFNAKLMLQGLTQEAANQFQSQLGPVDKFQQQMDQAVQNGARYEEVAYIGGYPLQDGNTYYFYVISRRGFAGPNQIDQIYYVFTVSPDGKIAKVE